MLARKARSAPIAPKSLYPAGGMVTNQPSPVPLEAGTPDPSSDAIG